MPDFSRTTDLFILLFLLACLFFAWTAIKKHVTFKWWVYNRAIKRSRKKEWEAYVDYYNGVTGPERWEHLLHVTELLRRRRDLERWNQWVPDDRVSRRRTYVYPKVEVRSTDPKCASDVSRDIAQWLKANASEAATRDQILEMLESYALIYETRVMRENENVD